MKSVNTLSTAPMQDKLAAKHEALSGLRPQLEKNMKVLGGGLGGEKGACGRPEGGKEAWGGKNRAVGGLGGGKGAWGEHKGQRGASGRQGACTMAIFLLGCCRGLFEALAIAHIRCAYQMREGQGGAKLP